jgi:squalene-hopene/tetraprenyl-beta-curcumene cyclase
MRNRAGHLFSLFLLFASGCTPRSEGEAMLGEACRFLWDQQESDGGWHSGTHGFLRGGQAWTPYVLHALLEAPDEPCEKPPQRVQDALDFIRRHTNADGVLGLADPDILEYPNYATAYAVRVLVRAGEPADRALIDKMTAYLVAQQFVEVRGVEADDWAYGGWGFGEQGLPPGSVGHVDLSHTRRVLQALREAGYEHAETYPKANIFLRLLQKNTDRMGADTSHFDGGFFASPVVADVNKAGRVPGASAERPVFRSYATTTSDGILALLAAGIPPNDERVQAAMDWLRQHPGWAYPGGIPQDDPAQWHRVLVFYHLAVRAETYAAVQEPGSWREEIVLLLAEKQRDDGSFSNPYGAPNKEDDPMLATALAVQALSYALRDPASE